MARGVVERVLERVAERMGRHPAWDGVRRADLLGRPDGAAREPLTAAEEDFSRAWGRATLRDDDADERAQFPGFSGAV